MIRFHNACSSHCKVLWVKMIVRSVAHEFTQIKQSLALELYSSVGLTPVGLLSPKLYVDVPAWSWKSDFLYTNFLPNSPHISIQILKEKHPILTKLGAFYNSLPKIHTIYVIWAPSSLMNPPPPITMSNFMKKEPQKAGTYTMSMWDPPPLTFSTQVSRADKTSLSDLVKNCDPTPANEALCGKINFELWAKM